MNSLKMPIRRARCGRCQAKSANNTGCLIEHFGALQNKCLLPEAVLKLEAKIVRCCLWAQCDSIR